MSDISYSRLVDYCKEYNLEIPTRFQHFTQNSIFCFLFDSHYSFMMRIWLFTGNLFDWIRIYNKHRDDALKHAKECLNEAFTPQLKKMLEEKLKDDIDI